MTTIDISKLDKAAVLASLFNASKTQGLGFLQPHAKAMDKEEAQSLLDDGHTYFDYLRGRVMKIDLSKDEMDTWLYDRDNGEGSAKLALSDLL